MQYCGIICDEDHSVYYSVHSTLDTDIPAHIAIDHQQPCVLVFVGAGRDRDLDRLLLNASQLWGSDSSSRSFFKIYDSRDVSEIPEIPETPRPSMNGPRPAGD